MHMKRIALCVVAMTNLAIAAPKLPVVGETLAINGAEGWPAFQWMYEAPNGKDAAGKVVVHWFCAPKLQGCTEDLARLMTLKETSTGVYIIAYLDGAKAQVAKLDPIRGSEGVGRGTVGFGPPAAKFFKELKLGGPLSFVVDVDNKVQLVTVGSGVAELDARDAKVKSLVAGVKLHTTTLGGPKTAKAGQKFDLTFTIKLASWLVFSSKPGTNYEWKAIVPTDVKCDHTALKGDQLKPVGQTLEVKMTCSGPRGSYEATGQIQFGYDVPSGGSGLGADGGKWKFDLTP
jgi:hypothetical protein